ncbi:MAG: NADH-quinone oxidoreductase subunit L [Coriobacteriia bacterium]|nr:NADH-quinone oxidoreductase subunit L [Coriobacteriia bacterium]
MSSTMSYYLLLIPLIPTLVFAALLFLPRDLRNRLMYVSPIAMGTSALISIIAGLTEFPGGPYSILRLDYRLATLGEMPLNLTIDVGPLSLIMLVMVTVIGTCVQVYSLSYMKDDERRGWYFTVMSLFTAAMLLLVMSGDLLLIFAMWEIMGLCSYMLIGFWYKEKAPRRASQKAFLVTRAGDGGFFVALAAIYAACGTFNINDILASAPGWAPWVAAVAALGLLWAAMGKSAQLPLSVWLPDAMAGPTPGSALIHAATMVAAGVFMVARMLPLFELTPFVLTITLWIGVATALFGAILACFQNDIKKVLAYSTISQLGVMFVALGVGSALAALFHLYTHAFFKALLFLGAGSIIHATHTQDTRKMGGLAQKMPLTTVCFTIGAFALAGVAPLTGFFSKDEVFAVIKYASNYPALVLACAMGVTTSLYVTKMWLRVFFGKAKTPHVHEGGILELAPLGVLAAATLFGGISTRAFGDYIGDIGVWPSWYMATISTCVTLAGATLGYLAVRGKFDRFKEPLRFVGAIMDNKLYLDAFYDNVIIKPYFIVSDLLWKFDEVVVDGIVNGVVALYRRLTRLTWRFDEVVVDGAVNGTAAAYLEVTEASRIIDESIIDGAVNSSATLSQRFGTLLRKAQTGKLQTYQRLAIGGLVLVLVLVVVLKGM